MKKLPGYTAQNGGILPLPVDRNVPSVYDGGSGNYLVAENDTERAWDSAAVLSNRAAQVTANAVNTGTNYFIGAHHFGGWRINEPGVTWRPNPWATDDTTNRIFVGSSLYQDRHPLIGLYNENDQWVMDAEIKQAYEHGIDFFAFCFYWNAGGGGTYHQHPMERFKASSLKGLMRWCVTICNHSPNPNPNARIPNTQANWDGMITYLRDNCFNDPQYLKIGGRPVVYMFDPDLMWAQASFVKSGSTTKVRAHNVAIFNDANTIVGGSGIYWVACRPAHPFWVGFVGGQEREIGQLGYQAVSEYNGRGACFGNQNLSLGTATQLPGPRSYAELDAQYRSQWDWILTQSNTTLKYFVPLTAGWDSRAWGGRLTNRPLEEPCYPSVEAYTAHLAYAKSVMDANSARCSETIDGVVGARRVAISYAWNEIGEGAFLTPSNRYSTALLQAMRTTFGK